MASISIASADPTAPLQQPVCQNCQTSTTPLWRRDESGSVLCNACGLFLKLHGRPRPISLKTDVIKSRNRVKTATQGPKKKFEQNGGPPAATDNMNPHRRVSQMAASVASDRSQSPISRTGTPGAQHDPNIAPQHLFDGVTALADAHYSNGIPTDPALQLSQPPAALSNGQHGAAAMSYDDLVGLTNSLRTRVSELEVINMVYHDNESNLCRERDRALQERDEYKRKVEELERQLLEGQADDEHVAKRPRLSPPAPQA
ncbi:GATA-binding protein, other eukaryote [Cladophialophora yegresii CBS 114405]|uniref:GATA-binding protein, other eukaryote n=1 Tax=Cladophialophora yegresii CBS 114405 TaxID=1182544 RepID=W9VF18_9EURO|nr:GATA-binding protein, other eukaryote [Cladophialophora yegresii CBS 114405]EXJ54068.1 GATA-binding protein, other eukaryote [Cladophialophora yegresii CBS 114405]